MSLTTASTAMSTPRLRSIALWSCFLRACDASLSIVGGTKVLAHTLRRRQARKLLRPEIQFLNHNNGMGGAAHSCTWRLWCLPVHGQRLGCWHLLHHALRWPNSPLA